MARAPRRRRSSGTLPTRSSRSLTCTGTLSGLPLRSSRRAVTAPDSVVACSKRKRSLRRNRGSAVRLCWSPVVGPRRHITASPSVAFGLRTTLAVSLNVSALSAVDVSRTRTAYSPAGRPPESGTANAERTIIGLHVERSRHHFAAVGGEDDHLCLRRRRPRQLTPRPVVQFPHDPEGAARRLTATRGPRPGRRADTKLRAGIESRRPVSARW